MSYDDLTDISLPTATIFNRAASAVEIVGTVGLTDDLRQLDAVFAKYGVIRMRTLESP